MAKNDDLEYMRDLKAAVQQTSRVSANLLFFMIIAFMLWSVYWASQAELNEVTKGIGKVIPSTELQVIQNLEGGIVSAILVKKGDIVEVGQPLMTIDDTLVLSKQKEGNIKRIGLLALTLRLKAEIANREPIFPEEILNNFPKFAAREVTLMKARSQELKSARNVLGSQRKQKQQEIVELKRRVEKLNQGLELALEELTIIEPLVEREVVSQIELIQLKSKINDIQTDISASEQALPRLRSAVNETKLKIKEQKTAFLSKANTELNEAEVNLKALEENLTATGDVLKRTTLKSPVSGTIKQIKINTVGGVVRPGMDIMEITPLDETLLIEAKIKPSDIAFLSPDLPAKVKITAYDFSIYGSLDAEIVQISADTITDENDESFYEIRVRTDKNYIEGKDGPLQIIPGMTAEVDVLTGKKTVLDYILKPLTRARQNALTER